MEKIFLSIFLGLVVVLGLILIAALSSFSFQNGLEWEGVGFVALWASCSFLIYHFWLKEE